MKTRSISIEEWCALAKSGEVMPIKIQLNGKSMQPLIRMRYDYVTVVPLRREPVKGDIVVFLDRQNRYCAHRVKCVKENHIQTLGDNCFKCDPWIKKHEAVGLIVAMERNGKKYNLDSALFRFYGRVRMSLLPVRRLNHLAFLRLWKFYKRLFKNTEGG